MEQDVDGGQARSTGGLPGAQQRIARKPLSPSHSPSPAGSVTPPIVAPQGYGGPFDPEHDIQAGEEGDVVAAIPPPKPMPARSPGMSQFPTTEQPGAFGLQVQRGSGNEVTSAAPGYFPPQSPGHSSGLSPMPLYQTPPPPPRLAQFESFDTNTSPSSSQFLVGPTPSQSPSIGGSPQHDRTGSTARLLQQQNPNYLQTPPQLYGFAVSGAGVSSSSYDSDFAYRGGAAQQHVQPFDIGGRKSPRPARGAAVGGRREGSGGHAGARRPWYSHYPLLAVRRWNALWSMYLFLVIGLCFAAGHHSFYASLHGRESGGDQMRMLRYGAALAFAVKAALAGCVIIAFRQRVWMSVRRRMFTITAVDSLFAAAEDVTALVNAEVFKQAKVAMLLAVFVWLTPLVVILTSDTLAVELATIVDSRAQCPSVRTLNFSHEETNDWRTPLSIDNLFGLSVSFWNTTSLNASDAELFDYYTEPSGQFERLAVLATYLNHAVPRTSAAGEVCGAGWNCSVAINFTGPGYICTELAKGVGSQVATLGTRNAVAPFNTSVLAPEGNNTYYAIAFEGDYVAQQVPSGDAGIPLSPPPYPKNLGAFRTEPILWVGYSAVANSSVQEQPWNRSDPRWATAYTPHIFGCEYWEMHYAVAINYTAGSAEAGSQQLRVLSRTPLNPIVDTVLQRDEVAHDGTLDNTTATPAENYVFPPSRVAGGDVRKYRRTATYHSLGNMLRRFINGTITANKIVHGTAFQTRLIDLHTWLPVANLQDAVEGLYEDMLLSLLGNAQFLAVSWAADASIVAGNVPAPQPEALVKARDNVALARGVAPDSIDNSTLLLYPCVRSRTSNQFHYNSLDLWLVYGVSILLAAGAVALGTLAVWEGGGDGVVRDMRFSSIVRETRALPGQVLGPRAGGDAVGGAGADGGAVGVAREKSVKVGYGLVKKEGPQLPSFHQSPEIGGFEMVQGVNAAATPGIERRETLGFGLEGEVKLQGGSSSLGSGGVYATGGPQDSWAGRRRSAFGGWEYKKVGENG